MNFRHDLEWDKVDPKVAFTYELCAGICDKDKTDEETIQEEILEGYLRNLTKKKFNLTSLDYL